MQDLAFFFAVIFGISAENWGGKWEIQIRAGSGFLVFMGGWDVEFTRATQKDHAGISILT